MKGFRRPLRQNTLRVGPAEVVQLVSPLARRLANDAQRPSPDEVLNGSGRRHDEADGAVELGVGSVRRLYVARRLAGSSVRAEFSARRNICTGRALFCKRKTFSFP